MRSYALRQPAGLDQLELIEVPDPGAPAAGQVRLRVLANSTNYHDLGIALGKLPSRDGHVPLADASAIVEAVGAGVAGIAEGDHVISHFFPQWSDGPPVSSDFSASPGEGLDGYARDVAVVPAHWVTPAPAGLSHAEAATLPIAALTAWRALIVDGQLKPGETVLVLGSGGVSVFALQFAKAAGARVIATSSSNEKLDRLKALGADAVVNYRDQPDWGRHVATLTDGGVDHVVEVGGPGTLTRSIEAVRRGGHISMVGVLTGFHGDVSLDAITLKQIRLQGLITGSRRHQLEMVRGIEAIGLRPQIGKRFPFEQLADAFRYQAAGAHFGKIVIER